MRLPHDVCDKTSKTSNTKSPEVVNVIGDPGGVLEEFDLTESGNQIHSYVKVKPGDEITLKYAIPGMGEQIIDVYIDGVLRETHITNTSQSTTHKGNVKKVCACEVRPSGAKGKMEYYYMVIEERKTSKDISPSSHNFDYLKPSAVGAIEVRVLREMSLATKLQVDSKPEQAKRDANFEESLRWWNVSGRIDPGIIAPMYQIGFINGRKTQGSSRKNIKRSIEGYYLWASFKFFYRSASDIQAAGLKIVSHPRKLPTTNTVNQSASMANRFQSTESTFMAAAPNGQMSSLSLEGSTKIPPHIENWDLTSTTASKDRKDKADRDTPRSSKLSCENENVENDMKRIEHRSSEKVKIENMSGFDPHRLLLDEELLRGTQPPEYHQAATPILDQEIVGLAEDQKAVVRDSSFHEINLFVSQHKTLHDGFDTDKHFDRPIEGGGKPAAPGVTVSSSSFLHSSIPSDRDVSIVSETVQEMNTAPAQKSFNVQRVDPDCMMRAEAGHYISRSPLADKETESFESQAKAMTNGKGDWRGRATKMLEAISAPLDDHALTESSRIGLAHEDITAQDSTDKSLTNPTSDTLKKRNFDQFSVDSSPPFSGNESSLSSQLGQGISPKQLREEHARKRMAKQLALKNKMEEAAMLRRQVEKKEAERAAQQELELQVLDAETQKFEAEAQAWAARLRELSEE